MTHRILFSSGPVILLGCILCCSICCQQSVPAQNDQKLAVEAPPTGEPNRPNASGAPSAAQREATRKLPLEEQLRVARSALNDPDARMKSYGVYLLVELGYEDEAVSGFAELVTAGQDVTALGWAWTHARDDLVAPRMYVKASYYLLDHLDGLARSEREQAEQFLCSGGLANPIAEFSRDAVVQRLRNLELELVEHEQD